MRQSETSGAYFNDFQRDPAMSIAKQEASHASAAAMMASSRQASRSTPPALGRRAFLQATAATAAGAGFVSFLAACGSSPNSSAAAGATGTSLTQATLQLNYLEQVQFAGTLMALANGYYHDAGVNVSVIPGALFKTFIDVHLGEARHHRKSHDTPHEVIKKQRPSWENLRVPTKEFSSPGRTVALLSYHRPDNHADARTRPPRE